MKKRLLIFAVLLLSFTLSAQNIQSMEFHDQNITDILLVLADSSGVSIIPDETVTGKASFYFSESTLQEALETFLATYKLFYVKENNVYKVSRINVTYNKEAELASLKADDVNIEMLIRAMSKSLGKTILYDTLPAMKISVDIENLSVMDILSICTKKLPEYVVEDNETYYYIKKKTTSVANVPVSERKQALTRDGNNYSLALDSGRLIETLTTLFSLEEVEYSFFLQSDIQLENLYFSNKDFNTMLRLILEQGNADYILKEGIYYIVSLSGRDVTSKLKQTETITLKYLQAQDLPTLLPSSLSSGSVLKIDKTTNQVMLTGSPEEIEPYLSFISMIDTPLSGMEYRRIDVNYLTVTDFISLIPDKMLQNQPIPIPGTNSLLACGTKESLQILADFLDTVDVKNAGIPIRLRYIQASTLLEKLPPSLSSDMVADSGYPNMVFYTGSEENLKLVQHELDLIDKPQPQISYQLLVIQYSKNNSTAITPSLSMTQSSDPSDFLFSGDLTNIMSLSFDVISNFGLAFAETLNAKIADNSANVYTDTTLTSLSGQEVKFQNTDTYRYIEYENNSTGTNGSGTTRTGITQQITSGLIVSLNGWISGDDMITMTVNATISKQNGSSSSSTSSTVATLPSTSERVVTTQVRTRSGEPIVISGLIKEDVTEVESKVPVLGSIPLLKHLFTQKSSAKDRTEIVIYIVPHVIQEVNESDTDALNIERYYSKFIGQ